jgi:steroid delta-isomerase
MTDHPGAAEPARARHDAALARATAFFEAISPEDVDRLDAVYAADAYFKDPFNEVRGRAAIRRVFAHMFIAMDAPRFIVRETVSDGEQAFLVWDFEFRFRRGSPRGVQRIRGCTQLRFDEQGLITFHRDFWDAAEELYEKLPLLGALMRWLRRKAAG